MYFSQGNVKVYFNDVASFLHAFILPPANLVCEEVACKIRVELRGRKTDDVDWQSNLVDVISIMRQYPLLSIKWNLVPPGHSEPRNDLGLADYVCVLKDMEDHEFGKISSIRLLLDDEPLNGYIYTILTRGCTEQDTDDIRLKFGGLRYQRGGIMLHLD